MDESFLDHKLCGFLHTVLTVNSPQSDLCETLSFNTRCYVFNNGCDVGFRSENGVVLSIIDSKPRVEGLEECDNVSEISPQSGWGKRRIRGIGKVNGSISVVHQLLTLVKHKCLKIDARVVWLEIGDDGEARVVLLVDVYLPVAALCPGWQFPKSGSVVGALFKHLSCDWDERNLILAGKEYHKYFHGGNNSIWDRSYCHVLGCKLHGNMPDASKKGLFELHEIFKSLPSVAKKEMPDYSRVKPVDELCGSGIWDVSDDILINILSALGPMDLLNIAATCRHLSSLAASVMPRLKLKLFPHQQTAVEWMLQRERHAGILQHPLYTNFATEDGFSFYANNVSGEIVNGVAPTVKDFRGGMFCDEPGLGKTITALSLILKTQGTSAEPPDGVQVIWCMDNGIQKCGYYELSGDKISSGNMLFGMRAVGQTARRAQVGLDKLTHIEDLGCSSPKRARLAVPDDQIDSDLCFANKNKSPISAVSEQVSGECRFTRSLSRIKRNILLLYEEETGFSNERMAQKKSNGRKYTSYEPGHIPQEKQFDELPYDCKRLGRATGCFEYNGWVQCDACDKWRKLAEGSIADTSAAWFCSMNTDPLYQSCSVPEESWDSCQRITDFPGFFTKGTSGGKEQNVSFFTSVLKEHYASIDAVTKKMLSWLVELSHEKLGKMETIGLQSPFISSCLVSDGKAEGFYKVFRAFGLIRKVEKGIGRWYYPRALENLSFDVDALRIALCEPLYSVRLYLSKATLVVVPPNLVDHWKTQIQKHVRPGQLRVYVWTDHRKPSAHSLAWDYDVVITTFNRLSAEWGPRKRSVLIQVHWLRVMLDEGHTLGSSLNLTNKLQMAVSLVATNRWILTGTPTPNTPNSQLSHLQPLLKFLHDEAYGQNQKLWEAGILRPFEAEMEEGRLPLLALLHRCMISAKKTDLLTIPPCIKKVTFLNFTEQHARSYNELVVTVRRNILMADWNDPSHVESLLNPKQWKFRSSTIKNVRLSCCVAGHIKVTDAGHDIQETMDILIEDGLDPLSEEYATIKSNILHGGNCLRCKEWCRLPVITPCRHLLCINCVALDSKKCTLPGCGNLYEMQTPETLARPENPNPKWPVPKDLIELQPSYKQDNWDPDWQSTSSSKVTYLVHRLKALQDANRETTNSMYEDSGGNYIVENNSSALLHRGSSRRCEESYKLRLEKVLIFSQFLEHIHVIEQQLTIAGIKFAGMYSPMHSSNKMKSLAMFQHDTSCMALLMDGSAALGLDLSFVTHVFLMEPIWDRSMEEQVISRAHRMGATRPIHVETLAMRGTIEEQMMEFLQDADECRRLLKEESQKPDREGARTHRTVHDFAESNYLAQLSFVHTNS